MTRRIGSDEAHAWARNLRLNNPLAKLVLCMLTQYINAEATCFVGIKALAEDCELSPNTVRERLMWLETSARVIRRVEQWIDEGGQRNSARRGRQTSDLIVLLIDGVEKYSPDEEIRALSDEALVDVLHTVSPPPGGGSDPPRGGGGDSAGTPVGLQLRGVPDSLNLNLKKKDARARARDPAGARAPAPAKTSHADPVDFICAGTRQWRALQALYAVEGKPWIDKLYPGEGVHANHTGRYFRRSEKLRALSLAAARAPPPDDPADIEQEDQSSDEDGDAGSGEFTASLRGAERSLAHWR